MKHGKFRPVFIFFAVVLAIAIFSASFMAAQVWMNRPVKPAALSSSVPGSSFAADAGVASQPAAVSQESGESKAESAQTSVPQSSSSQTSSQSSAPSSKSSTAVSGNKALTQTVYAEDFYLTIPPDWKMKKSDPVTWDFLSAGETVGSVAIGPYYPSEPFSQLFDNHTQVLSQKKLSGLCLPATEVLLRHTKPAATGNASYTDKYHIYFINNSISYELCFPVSLVSEKTALQIAANFQKTPVKILDTAPEELTSVCGDVSPTNAAFFEETKNYVLFGSMKSDPKQGVAVAFKNEFSKDMKGQVAQKYLTPQKCGAVRAIGGGGKDTVVGVMSADGSGWIFNLYNGFTGGHAKQ